MAEEANRESRILVCRVRERLCGLPLANVVETMRPLPVEPFSAMPAFVTGISLIRGTPVPIVDVGKLLGRDASPHFTRFVTLTIEDRQVALAVEEVLGVRAISSLAAQDLPPLLREASDEVIATVGALDQALLIVLRAARLLPDGGWSIPPSDQANP